MRNDDSEKWYYFYEDIPYGPLSADEIKNLIKEGRLPEDVKVHKGVPEWKTAIEMGLISFSLAIQELSGTVYPLEKKIIKIGRAPDNDIVISIPSVSRYHAQIFSDDEGNYWIENLEGKAGITISGNKVDKAKLMNGLEIQLGKWVAKVIRLDKERASSELTIFDNAGSAAAIKNDIKKEEELQKSAEPEPLPTVIHVEPEQKKSAELPDKSALESSMTQICPLCNNQLPSNAIFCGFCGANLKKASSVKEKSTKNVSPNVFCINCNKEIEQNAKFCPYCGQAQQIAQQNVNKQNNTIPITKCTNCGKEILKNSSFCGFCGAKVIK